MRIFKLFGITALITVILSTFIVLPAEALTSQQVNPIKALGKVNITSNSYFEVEKVSLFQNTNGKTLTITASIINNGNTNIQFIDYWAKVRTKSGAKYSVKLLNNETSNATVHAKSKQRYIFYSSVNPTTNLSDIIIEFIKWDFSKPNFESTLGKITIPQNYNAVISYGSSDLLVIGESPILTQVDEYYLNKIGDTSTASLDLIFNNTGKYSIMLPNYKYYLQTSDGINYQLESGLSESIQLQPGIEKLINLSGTLPTDRLGKYPLKLIITQEEATSKQELALGAYEVKENNNNDTTPGNKTLYKNKNGEYTITLNQAQRLPSEEEDLITLDITIRNNDSSKSIPLINLTGVLELDGIRINNENTKTIILDNVINLQTNTETNVVIYTRLPYTYTFSNAKFLLQEIENEKLKTIKQFDLGAITLDGSIPAVKKLIKVENIGQRAEIKVKSASIYKGVFSDLFYGDVEITNMEKRNTSLIELGGFIKAGDGNVYPATIENITEKVLPNGKIIASYWGIISSGYSTSDLQIYIGQKIVLDNDSSLIKTFAIQPISIIESANEIKSISIEPYTIDFSYISATVIRQLTNEGYEEKSRKLNFDYYLENNYKYEKYPDGHQLILELTDGKLKYTKKLEFNVDLLEGYHRVEFDIPTLKIGGYQYTISIYDEYKGHKKLLAEQRFSWNNAIE